jgi:RNA-directed DNA polymerase
MRPKPATNVSSFDRLRSRPHLTKAYRHVQAAGLASTSSDIRAKTKEFNAEAVSNIERIQRQLRGEKFIFEAPHVTLISKGQGKGKRGILIAPIESRIVQRAILDELTQIPENKEKIYAGFNFGGVSGNSYGVKPAVLKALELGSKYQYFLRSDVQKFFDKVPRRNAVSLALAGSTDEKFNRLVGESVEVDEKAFCNISDDDRQIFLGESLGLAQGSSISAMLCNLYLHSFDVLLNARGIECIRYVDDFIIFGPNKSSVRKAFTSAISHLNTLGLEAYDPATNPAKAEEGATTEKISFLGCEIHKGVVRPSQENRKAMLDNLKNSLSRELTSLRKGTNEPSATKSIANAAKASKAIVEGWGNSFAFCNDHRLFRDVDGEIQKLVDQFLTAAKKILSTQPARTRQKAMGFHFLEDCSGMKTMQSGEPTDKNL